MTGISRDAELPSVNYVIAGKKTSKQLSEVLSALECDELILDSTIDTELATSLKKDLKIPVKFPSISLEGAYAISI